VDFRPTPCAVASDSRGARNTFLDYPATAPHSAQDRPRAGVAAWSQALHRFGLPILALVLTLWNLLLFWVLIFGLPQNDFCRMYYTARAYWQGEDMYGWNPATPARVGDDKVIQLWNMNPPHFHLVLLPLGLLPPTMALACWWGISMVCLVVAIRWITVECGLVMTPRVRQLGLVALLGFTGTNCMILTSQLAFVLLVPMTLAWLAARQERWRAAGFWLGVVISVKPFLLMFVPYLVLRRRWSALAMCAGSIALCFALGLMVFGMDNHLAWCQRLGIADSWAWLPMNSSVLGMLARTFGESISFTPLVTMPQGFVMAVSLTISAVIAMLTWFVTTRDSRPGDVDRSFALLLVASVMLCPLGWAYYFWLAVGPVPAVMLSWRRTADCPARVCHGRRIFWLGFVGLFWPVQFNLLFQPASWATVLIANVYFWTVLAIWTGLLLHVRFGTTADAPASSSLRMALSPAT
jgi:hypothetical protein